MLFSKKTVLVLTFVAGLAYGEGDPVAGQKLFQTGAPERGVASCVSCHGVAGNSVLAVNPKLAGQIPAYLVKQLQDFKSGARPNAVMGVMAKPLTDQEMADVAAYLSTQKSVPAGASSRQLVSQGERFYRGGVAGAGIPACIACHGPAGAGIPNLYPRLAGQFPEYIEARLITFRGGANSPTMVKVAHRLRDEEIKALAQYVAGLP